MMICLGHKHRISLCFRIVPWMYVNSSHVDLVVSITIQMKDNKRSSTLVNLDSSAENSKDREEGVAI